MADPPHARSTITPSCTTPTQPFYQPSPHQSLLQPAPPVPTAYHYTSPGSSPAPPSSSFAFPSRPLIAPTQQQQQPTLPAFLPGPAFQPAGGSSRVPASHLALPYTTVPLATVHERHAAALASASALASVHSLPPRAHSYGPSSPTTPLPGPSRPQRASLPSLSPSSAFPALPPSPSTYLSASSPHSHEQARLRRMYEDRHRQWGPRHARQHSAASMSSASASSSSSPVANYHPLALSPHDAHAGLSGAGAAGLSADGKKDAGRRKKVAKACLACQKSHLTCDEQRPCTRCVKKGMGDQCVEGVRKKAKYLLEGDERVASSSAMPDSISPPAPPQHVAAHIAVPPAPQVALAPSFAEPLPPLGEQAQSLPNDIWLTAPMQNVQDVPMGQPAQQWGQPEADPFSFTSAAANTEYEMFDSLFGPLSPSFPVPDLAPSSFWNFALPDAPVAPAGTALGDPTLSGHSFQPAGPATAITGAGAAMPPLPALSDLSHVPNAYAANPAQANAALASHRSSITDPQVNTPAYNDGGLPQPTIGDTPDDSRTLADIYQGVTQGYDYTEGYHFLMRHLQDNFDKTEVLRVVKALAAYRPSLIALQVNMSKEDEVFLEQAFQRTMIELEKQEALSDTPKAIWRRTGEIVYASRYFCQIVGRDAGELYGPGVKTYIYQLMSKPSMIQYWENFSGHAFENTTQYWYQTTHLLVGDGASNGYGDGAPPEPRPQPFAAAYSIRRDVFDLPSVVIGSFLPVPTAEELRQ
ncbi:Transcriptional regulator of nonfermentable carbon utilization [Cryptotrichosporon argae]